MFKQINSHALPVLKGTLEEYVAEDSGARHIHLRTEQDELAFLVGFPTVPQVSDGRAHILEHLALCGSERYPVADPFFAMMRRSTATFMNAMTYPDRTVYPFATTDRTDFFNLLDIYLDATFFPKLDYLSFRQEGWRHVVKDGKLGYQGVVLNEMKGAYGNPMRALNAGLAEQLFEGTTYAVDSGGDPLVIPELSHEALLDFHATHYHPSQAFFLTAGRISAQEIQARIAERVLSRKSGRHPVRMPELAPVWESPRRVDIRIPSQEARADEFGVQLAWRVGQSRSALDTLRLELLGRGLLGDASAPVLKAMQSAGFGRPSQMNGVDPGARQLVFHLGMEGLTEAQIEPALACMRGALAVAAEDGVPAEVFAAAIRDLRFSQREIRGGGMPDALSRLLGAVPALMYGAEVLPAFNNEAVLQALEKDFADPEFFKRMVRDLIASNTCLVARVVPDAAYASDRSKVEAERLAAQSSAFSEAELQRIQAEDAALAAHRKQGSRTDVLPRISPADVSREPRRVPEPDPSLSGAAMVEVASNGISYATLSFDLSAIDAKHRPWLALYSDLLPELGVQSMGFEEAAAWRQQLVPSFSIYLDTLLDGQTGGLVPNLCVFAGGLQENHPAIVQAIHAWALQPRFDETERIAFLARSRVEELFASLADNGEQLASLAASAPLSAQRAFSHETRGLASLPFWHALKAQLQSEDGAKQLAATLSALHTQVLACPQRVTWVSTQTQAEAVRALQAGSGTDAQRSKSSATITFEPGPLANSALVLSGQVNYCYMAWKAPEMGHADAPGLAVAAELLTHRILHRSLREEGGAYGGSASYASEDGVFTMSSYRDPRLAGTYADFNAALDELLAASYTQEALDEAIIGVIKRLDKPLSPYAQGMEADRLLRRGVSPAQRRAFRDAVLSCSMAQVMHAAQHWLKQGSPSRAAAAATADQDLAGLQPIDVLRYVG
ncbi:MAG: insulinase family protein [Casimicrobiaceae bacterium]